MRIEFDWMVYMEELIIELEELKEACEICSSQKDYGTCDGCSIASGIQQLENEIRERMKKVNIRWTIDLPMEFPDDWDSEMIYFHLNNSSWCCDNLIDLLEKYSEEHGCICNICEAIVI